MQPILDRTLWDYFGNHCRVELHHIGNRTFEAYFHDFNSAIPRRVIGSLGECNAQIDAWMAHRQQAGFSEAQSFQSDARKP